MAFSGLTKLMAWTWTTLVLSTQASMIIDSFQNADRNDLQAWHGVTPGLSISYGAGYVQIYPSTPDQAYHTQLSPSLCFNLTEHILQSHPASDTNPNSSDHQESALHIHFSGAPVFSISLSQNNAGCSSPTPETWDSVDAARYAHNGEIYIPLSHFDIDQTRVVGISIGGFHNDTAELTPHHENTTGIKHTRDDDDEDQDEEDDVDNEYDEPLDTSSIALHHVDIVSSIPDSFPRKPTKLPSGTLHQFCTLPGSFAFGIDDGKPALAPAMMRVLEEEDALVTFFATGSGLRDEKANFSGVYREMLRKGHQVAMHSERHPRMEGLSSIEAIDDEITQNIEAMKTHLGIECIKLLPPPYGTVGARTRQRLAALVSPAPRIITWSVDIEDWRWVNSDTPERQLEAFKRDVLAGGNLAVLHYLDESTVGYLREAIRFVRARGLTVMRVDRCLGD
ncbi:glycoside hydrolase/deacetylase [Aspergillus campestris IBT 28561]|uniref:Glycoside hydrolase/deacetylase n=1 Tax=Aspergillus campestris (strain IBT 28561) TaxID=1392248 RepID=A0A2I1DDB4_ASPC2|nr:glycoside hydrolase/deacetylase [Aspergillus campestris IBT 28561]PKY07868.1 glycoside hydrolase/deacetylase [Aspergillus campestris IBT 28561]